MGRFKSQKTILPDKREYIRGDTDMVSARTIALVLVVVGATAFALPTFATEGFDTERPTSFAIGSDESALIGSEETENTVKHPGKLRGSGPPTVTVGYLVNNFDSELSLTYRVSDRSGSVTTHPPDNSGQSEDMTLAAGQKGAIDLRCEPGNQGTGTTSVTVTVDSAYADGIGVEDAKFDFQVQYDCSPPSNQGNGGSGESETIKEYCANSAAGEDENENENENENSGNKYKYTYDYDYDYKNGKYRYEYEYDYKWSKNAEQNPDPNPSTSPDQSLDCVTGDSDIDIDPDPDPDPDPPDKSG